MKNLIIIGASGHGKVIADIALKNGYDKIEFLDDDASIVKCGKFSVVGKSADYNKFLNKSDFFVGIGNSVTRERIMNMLLENGAHVPVLIHPSAVIDNSVNIGVGTVIMAGVVVNADTKIGKGCIVNTCASCDHDNVIGDFAHIAVGARLAGTVRVGKHTWVGAGAVVKNNVNVCDNCMIGAGAVVVKDIEQPGTYVGVPAKRIIYK